METKYQQLENSSISLAAHLESDCTKEFCAIHKRSSHVMRNFPQFWDVRRKLMMRICAHNLQHPDPDDESFHGDEILSELIHDCDGCCKGSYQFIEEGN